MTRNLLTLLAMCVLAAATGCHAIDFYTPSLQEAVPPELEPPRELSMVSLPSYRITPSDVLSIDVLNLIPRPSYRINPSDTLQIKVLGALQEDPIWGPKTVTIEGNVNLGASYGVAHVAGLTIEEAEAEITRVLRLVLKEPVAAVQLDHSATTQLEVAYTVQPDGVIDLGKYGMVRVVGKTVAEAQLAVQEQLAQYFESPRVGVEVLGYNGNKYYVIINGKWIGGVNSPTTVRILSATHLFAELNETQVRREFWLNEHGMVDRASPFMLAGNETVLDAISKVNQIEKLPPMSSESVWIARPAPDGVGEDQILPVDWHAITQGMTDTNYQILPGDRIFIAQDSASALGEFVDRFTTPIEKLLSLSKLGADTIHSSQVLGRQYNALRPQTR